MRHKFLTEQWIAAPVEQVFAFFADPENLPRLMPRWQRAHIQQARLIPPQQHAEPCADTLGGTAAGEGSEMTIRFRPFPLSPIQLSWRARITEFAWNDHFCDEQLSGPFTYWRHCHRVRPEIRNGAPGTLVQDHVEYELPFGLLGEVGNWILGRRQIASIFRYRQTTLKKIFDGLCAPTVDPVGLNP